MVVRLVAAGICGTDVAHYISASDVRSGRPGFPLHECVGEVIKSTCSDIHPFQRVLAMPEEDRGLQEIYIAHRNQAHPLLTTSLNCREATLIQPLATVLAALNKIGDVGNKRCVVLGLGPIGLMVAHALKKMGAQTVIGVHLVDRSPIASVFDFENILVEGESSYAELSYLEPEVCVEAVGHQQETIRQAVQVTSEGGTILAFGVPDEADYTLPFERLFRKNLTLTTSVNPSWQRWFPVAERYLTRNLEEIRIVLTHEYSMRDAPEAFHFCATRQPQKAKVILTVEGWN